MALIPPLIWNNYIINLNEGFQGREHKRKRAGGFQPSSVPPSFHAAALLCSMGAPLHMHTQVYTHMDTQSHRAFLSSPGQACCAPPWHRSPASPQSRIQLASEVKVLLPGDLAPRPSLEAEGCSSAALQLLSRWSRVSSFPSQQLEQSGLKSCLGRGSWSFGIFWA